MAKPGIHGQRAAGDDEAVRPVAVRVAGIAMAPGPSVAYLDQAGLAEAGVCGPDEEWGLAVTDALSRLPPGCKLGGAAREMGGLPGALSSVASGRLNAERHPCCLRSECASTSEAAYRRPPW